MAQAAVTKLIAALHYVQHCNMCNIALREALHYVQHCIMCNIALPALPATLHYLQHRTREFPRSGSKASQIRKKISKVGDNNGQTMHYTCNHERRTQAAWAKINKDI